MTSLTSPVSQLEPQCILCSVFLPIISDTGHVDGNGKIVPDHGLTYVVVVGTFVCFCQAPSDLVPGQSQNRLKRNYVIDFVMPSAEIF